MNYIFNMQLTQIGTPVPETSTVTIAEMFKRLAEREAEELRAARESALKKRK